MNPPHRLNTEELNLTGTHIAPGSGLLGLGVFYLGRKAFVLKSNALV